MEREDNVVGEVKIEIVIGVESRNNEIERFYGDEYIRDGVWCWETELWDFNIWIKEVIGAFRGKEDNMF